MQTTAMVSSDPVPESGVDCGALVFQATDELVLVQDDAGAILEVNPAACRHLGYSRETLLRLRIEDLLPEAETRSWSPSAALVGRTECRLRHRDGGWIAVEMRAMPVRYGDGPAVLLLGRDCTAQKRAERRVRVQFEVARILGAGEALEPTVAAVLKALTETLEFEAGFLWRAHKSDLRCLASSGAAGLLLQGPNELPARVAESGRGEEENLALATETPRTAAARAHGAAWAHAFPIRHGGATTAVLEFWALAEPLSDPEMQPLLVAIGNQLGQYLEHQRVEKELSDSQALYQSLVQNLPQNIFRKDRKGQVTFANQRYCETLRTSLDQLLGKTDFDLFPYELAAKYVADDRHILTTGEVIDTVEEHHLPDGSSIHVHVVKTPVRDALDTIIGIQGIFWDVTERVHATEAIARSERRYRQLTEATLDGIVVIDERGRIALFNPAAERLFGYMAAEVLGEPVALLLPEPFQQLEDTGVEAFLQQHRRDVVGLPREFQGQRRDGSLFPVEIALSILGESSDAGSSLRILAAIRDLTERNKMRAILVQNEKLASIGLLSAGVAHEINNPLAFVANNLVVLERDFDGIRSILDLYCSGDDKLEKACPELCAEIRARAGEIDLPYVRENLARVIQRTRQGVDRVTRIVQSLRGMARTEASRRQETHLPELIGHSLEILHGRYKHLGIEIEQQHDRLPVVPCVPTQISQVILNLLVNAFQAIEATRRTGHRIVVQTQRRQDELVLEVADTGCGIRPEHMSKLFDPFFTTKEVGEGTGLGLSITHQIVTAHGGRIEVESELGAGASFRVYLPLREKMERK